MLHHFEKRENVQPMNANFGILPELDVKIKDKKIHYQKLADRSLNNILELSKK